MSNLDQTPTPPQEKKPVEIWLVEETDSAGRMFNYPAISAKRAQEALECYQRDEAAQPTGSTYRIVHLREVAD